MNRRFLFLALMCCSLSFQVQAHAINYALENATAGEVTWFYLKLGFKHILPTGADHILFILSLCLLSNRLSTVLWQATAFTFAHSVTLALSMQQIITMPAAVVEPLIALSIVFVAVENLLVQKLNPWRFLVVFLFGLLHGMGFANALQEIGLPRHQFFTSIIFFNIGVELGQLAVIAMVFFFLMLPLRGKIWYRKALALPLSLLIALIAAFWLIERLG